MPTTWTKWPDHDDQGAPTGRWCIGPEGGDPVAVTVAATEAQADALTAYPDTIAALEEVMQLIEDGSLVRNTKNDGDPLWALKQYPLIMTLSRAAKVLAAAKGGQ